MDDTNAPQARRASQPPVLRAGGHVDQRLAPSLAELNSAATTDEVGQIVASHAAILWSARGAAVGVVHGAALRLVGAVGYDCATMAPGAQLPMTAGLPLTEAARTGDPVVQQGGEAGWVAVPLPGTPRALGSLVLSLRPESPPVDVGLLSELAYHASAALRRLGSVAGGLHATAYDDVGGLDIAVHQHGLAGRTGGDVVVVMADPRGGCWLLVADVCGADVEAARAARDLHLVARGVAPLADGPAALLHALDMVLRGTIGTDRFATALALRARPDLDGAWHIQVAVAGHPLPQVLCGGHVRPVGAPGLPLNLETVGTTANRPEATLRLAPGDVLLAGTDGLTDRIRGSVTDVDLGDALRATLPVSSADWLAAVLRDLTVAYGASRDDLSAVLLRVP